MGLRVTLQPLEHAQATPLGEGHRLLFLHVPKNAGTALDRYLSRHFEPREICPALFEDELQALGPLGCRPYRYFRGHFHYGVARALIGARPVALTFLRHSYERFLSHFSYVREQPDAQRLLGVSLDNLTLEEYVGEPALVADTSNVDRQTELLGGSLDPTTCSEIAAAADGPTDSRCLLRRAATVLERFEVVGIYERLEESLRLLAFTLGLEPVLQLAPVNVTQTRQQLQDVRAGTLGRIAEYNALDLELYDRALALFDQRYRSMVEQLAGRYSPARVPDAASIPPEMVFRWIMRRYRESLVAADPAGTSFRIDLCRKLPDPGWYLPERAGGPGRVCWTGPGRTSVLELPIEIFQDAQIRIRIVHALTPDILASLSLRVNDRDVSLRSTLDAAGASVFDGLVPREILLLRGDLLRLELEVRRTAVPNAVDPTNGDLRALGVAVDWIEVEPASEPRDRQSS